MALPIAEDDAQLSSVSEEKPMHATPKAEPFRIDVPEAVLADLKARLANTRWPTNEPKAKAWHYGAKMAFVQEAVTYWQTKYDWRKAEAELNARSAITRRSIAGKKVHFMWRRALAPIRCRC